MASCTPLQEAASAHAACALFKLVNSVDVSLWFQHPAWSVLCQVVANRRSAGSLEHTEAMTAGTTELICMIIIKAIVPIEELMML